MASRRKQDEKQLKILREIASHPENRTCFDCLQKGPTYINTTIGSFVCTSCSGILRGLNPPHRVKSISMASFTSEEVEQLKSKGNHYCHAVWLGLYDGKSNLIPDTKDEHKIRDFMISKYEKKRFYVDPSIAIENAKNTNSGSSSNVSTPGSSDSKSLGFGTVSSTNNSTSVSRPISSIQNACSTPCLNGLPQSSKLKPSSSVDLFSSITGGSSSLPKPFSPPSGINDTLSISKPLVSVNGGFANFDNANIYTNAFTMNGTTSSSSTAPIPYATFSSNPLTPLSTNSSSSTVPLVNAPAAKIVEDRYAALKDLDEEFKVQKDVPPITNGGSGGNGTMFGTSPSNAPFSSNGVANGVFGSSPVAAPGNFHPSSAVTNSSWNGTFQSANPFTGATNGNISAGWPTNGVFSPQAQQNPFSGGTDPNFNNQLSKNEPAPTPTWANFNNPSTIPTVPKIATNPWESNSTSNPFSASQVPSGGSKYNPFI